MRSSLNVLVLSALTMMLMSAFAVTCIASNDTANAQPSSVTITAIDEDSDLRALFALKVDDWNTERLSINGDSFDEITIPGETCLSPQGYPELPSIVRMVLIPPESGVEARILNENIQTAAGIRPVPGRRDENGDPVSEAARVNLSTFSEAFTTQESMGTDGFWPPQTIELGRPAILRGYRILPVRINPARWNPATGELRVAERLDFELNYDTDLNRVNLVQDPQRPRPSMNAYRIVHDLVINPPEPPRDLDEHAGAILYVTGASQIFNDLVTQLNPLMEWRRKMGWTVQLLRVQNNTDRNAVYNAVRQAYQQNTPAPEYVVLVGDAAETYAIACHIHANVANPYETDHPYACLDGDDILADVAVGRFVCDGPQMLATQVQKTIQYESDPYMGYIDNNQHWVDESGWYLRAAAASTDWRNGSSTNSLVFWMKDLLLSKGWSQVNTLVCSSQNQQPNPSQFIESNINGGCSIYMHRGWEALNGWPRPNVNNNLRNSRKLPFVILATCNTGDFLEHAYDYWSYIERFMYHTNGGSIGAIGTGGATHSYYNNCLVGGVLYRMLDRGLHSQGWALMGGKVDLYNCYFGRGDINHNATGTENWLCHTYIYNLMGDPAVDVYTAIPESLQVEHPEAFRVGETVCRVAVSDVEDQPVPGALVCLYKPEALQVKAWTDENGEVVLAMDPAATQNGSIFLTVTGHNLHTYIDTLRIANAETFIGAASFEINDQQGDGDGTANPGETLGLTVQVQNLGQNNPDGELNLTLTALTEYGSVLDGEVQFNQAPAAGESVSAEFTVQINGEFNPSQPAVFSLTAQVGEETWESTVAIPVAGPVLNITRLNWVGDPLAPGEIAEMTFTIRNSGAKATTPLSAYLETRQPTLSIPNMVGHFDAVAVGREAAIQQALRVSAHPLQIPGSKGDLALVVEGEDGFRQAIPFTITVGGAGEGTPFGPDDYGYVCFDDTDADWEVVPSYHWIEIDGRVGEIQGVNLNLRDTGASRDTSTVIELPFTFQYYGQEYNQATICTNGWMALGAFPDVMTGLNRPIPCGLTVPGMLCPFWDDLITDNSSGIFTWHDVDSARFVVEWSRMRRLMPGQSPVETFQVILYNPEHHQTLDGNADIFFQYLTIEDNRTPADGYGDTPYATVGIVSPDLNTGLQYTYWHQLTPGAATLQAERAIRFTTLVVFDTAHLYGTVLDAANNLPLEGVLVRTDFGFWAVTDSLGQYDIPELLVDEQRLYTIAASKVFYNDSVITGIEVHPDEELQLDFALLHPEFSLDFAGVDVQIENENANDFEIPLRNTGNGALKFNSKVLFTLPQEDAPSRDEMFRIFQSFNVTNTPIGVTEEGDTIRIGNGHVNGVVFVDSLFYVSAGGNDRTHQLAVVYRFNRAGVFKDSLTLPWEDNWGLRGMEFDGELIWGAYRACMYSFDPATMALQDSIVDSLTQSKDVAFDPANGIYYTTGITDPIKGYDRQGNLVRSWRPAVNGQALRKYGLSWHPLRESSKKLFIHAILNEQTTLYACDPETQELEELLVTPGSSNGMDVTDRWNSSVWTLCKVVDGAGGDVVQVLELEPNTTWLSYSPTEGTVNAGESVPFHVRVESTDKPWDRYWITLRYDFNAVPGWFEIPICMEIVEHSGFSDEIALPLRFSIDQNYPNPFNPSTTIGYSLDRTARVQLRVFDVTGRLVQMLEDGLRMPGTYQVAFDGSKLPNGVYVCELKAGGRTALRKMVLLK